MGRCTMRDLPRFDQFELEGHDHCVFDYLEIREGGAEGPLVGRWAPTLHWLQVLWVGRPASLHLGEQPAAPDLPLGLLHRPLGLPDGLRGRLRGGVLRSQWHGLLALPPGLLPKVGTVHGASTIPYPSQPIPSQPPPVRLPHLSPAWLRHPGQLCVSLPVSIQSFLTPSIH